MGSQLRAGEVYRSGRNTDPDTVIIDGHPNIHHATASRTLSQIQLSKGINPLAKIKGPGERRRPAVLIRSSPWKAGTTDTPWHDRFDLENGRVVYFGDHRATHTVPLGSTQGNAVLLEVLEGHRATTAHLRARSVPLLVFAAVPRNKTPKGYVEFCGLAVIEHAEQIEQESDAGLPFPNYRYDLSLLDLGAESGEVDWSWIEARGNTTLSTDEALARAPRAWRRWVEHGSSPRPASGDGASGRIPSARVSDAAAAAALAKPSSSEPSSSETLTETLTETALLAELTRLKVHGRKARPTRHEPLALLWAMSRAAAGHHRPAPWRQFREEVGGLMKAFGLPGSAVTPEYPFWRLRTSPLWSIDGGPPEEAGDPTVATLDRLNPRAGITEQAARLLSDPLVMLRAASTLHEAYLHDVDLPTLLERLGMSGYLTASGIEEPAAAPDGPTVPAPRSENTVSRIIRNSALKTRLKRLHGDRCQVCALQLPTGTGTYSEGAHIRGLGRPHNGPDEITNLLVLCPNHHVQFDTLAIYVDPVGTVRTTADDTPLGPLRRHLDHPISETHLHYHRTLCTQDTANPKPSPT
ncbi:HNH endonuclease [Streptomyces sp. NPDC087917]|uniref:HNH endonuclease n=1 Tax=Streptomyces sp. NPDC087917 TaxID=3155060 RepID=UPI00342ECFA4